MLDAVVLQLHLDFKLQLDRFLTEQTIQLAKEKVAAASKIAIATKKREAAEILVHDQKTQVESVKVVVNRVLDARLKPIEALLKKIAGKTTADGQGKGSGGKNKPPSTTIIPNKQKSYKGGPKGGPQGAPKGGKTNNKGKKGGKGRGAM